MCSNLYEHHLLTLGSFQKRLFSFKVSLLYQSKMKLPLKIKDIVSSEIKKGHFLQLTSISLNPDKNQSHT